MLKVFGTETATPVLFRFRPVASKLPVNVAFWEPSKVSAKVLFVLNTIGALALVSIIKSPVP